MKKIIFVFITLSLLSMLLAVPKFSSWDGVAYCVKDYMDTNLHNPKSLKIQNAYTITSVSGDYIQRVTYRAKNAFGGLVLEDNVFFMKSVAGGYSVYDVWSYEEFLSFMQLFGQ